MTEDEAKTKWCPHARVWNGEGTAYNRDFNHGESCFGSACMMWRWNSIAKIEGYCGLAGKP